MIRFNAKILTPVNKVSKYIINSEPKIAETPTSNGIALATRLPKTKIKNMKVSGIEMISDNFKSSAILVFIAWANTPVPLA